MKLLRVSTSLVLLGCVIAAFSATSAYASGNSDAAHLCQQGGYANLLGTDGKTDVTFGNPGQCTSFAAQGGTLVSKLAAAPCLNGGFKNLAPANNQVSAFLSEAACVLYVAQGGTAHPLGFYFTSTTIVTSATDHCWQGVSPGKVSGPLWNSYTYTYPGSVLCFQHDGNLVIYSSTGYPLWASNTDGHPGASLAFQSDGNLVIYATNGAPLWSSATYGNPGACVVFQNDGNLVVYSSCG